jgi:hypothetical protein
MKEKLFFILVVVLAAALMMGAKFSSKTGALKGYTKVSAAAPAEPYDCTAGNEGEIIYVDDNNDNGYAKLCFCSYDDNPGAYEWVNADGLAACF